MRFGQRGGRHGARDEHRCRRSFTSSDFSTAHSDFQVDRTGRELVDFKRNLQLMLQTGMVTDLTDRLVPRGGGDEIGLVAQSKTRGWSRGQFTTVEAGQPLSARRDRLRRGRDQARNARSGLRSGAKYRHAVSDFFHHGRQRRRAGGHPGLHHRSARNLPSAACPAWRTA